MLDYNRTVDVAGRAEYTGHVVHEVVADGDVGDVIHAADIVALELDADAVVEVVDFIPLDNKIVAAYGDGAAVEFSGLIIMFVVGFLRIATGVVVQVVA